MKLTEFIIISCLLSINFLIAQQRTAKVPGTGPDYQDRILERQLSYAEAVEKRGDINSAYLAYSQLIRKHDSDRRVLAGYVDLSIKNKKIKECEVTLKGLAKKYPLASDKKGSVKETDTLPLEIMGYIAELYFRTERPASGQEIFAVIDASAGPNKTISGIKASVYLRSGYYTEAEKIFRELRNIEKDGNAYSFELFTINYSLGKINKFTEELIKSAVSDMSKDKKTALSSTFNPRAELFRLYEVDQFRDSILYSAENMYASGTTEAGSILSELYFSSGEYDKAYETLRNTSRDKSSDVLIKEFAVKLYREKNYEKASYFFRLYHDTSGRETGENVTMMFISSLIGSSDYAGAEKIIKESGIKNSELMLAELYHNRLGKADEAVKLYKENLKSERAQGRYWRDYLLLLISKGDHQAAKRSAAKVFEENIADVFDPLIFTEFKYLEAVIHLFLEDREKFTELSEVLITDNFPSDRDNDLIRIRKDISVIGDDDEFLRKYLKTLSKNMDSTADTGVIEFRYEDQTDLQKKLLMMETLFKYLELNGMHKELLELSVKIADSGMMDNNFARLITAYAKKSGNADEMKPVLLSILKSGAGEEIKAEIREIIRERDPS